MTSIITLELRYGSDLTMQRINQRPEFSEEAVSQLMALLLAAMSLWRQPHEEP
ncbi:hypothetical protein H8A97_08245 [Bradyrhizobium sp. Arg62]|uniref:hypothetical protein n=1 Tax=Bradyrhizobium brasilense TaxID=1419277 RepID=UPI001E2A9113|nr:hypothetical protein [Bradyrhizobium brasilense]MCC8945100.1 hypothetical protein [Bradyrhizobium brasilense]